MEISTGLSIDENLKCQQFDNSKKSTQDVSCDPQSTDNRVRRATDEELSAEVERMQKVARLATGISIQLDLISGTLNPDELISELLHLGSVTPAQIIAMNDTDIQSAISQWKTLPTRLSSSTSSTVEEKLEDLMEIWMLVKEGGDGTEWVGKDAFITEMKSVSDNKIGLESGLNVDGFISSWLTFYGILVNPNMVITSDDVNRLKNFTKNITSSIPELTAAAKNGVKLPNMFRAEEGVNPLSSLVAAVTTTVSKKGNFTSSPANEPDLLNTIVGDVEKISDVSNILQSSSASTAKNGVKARLSAVNSGSSKFPGFANGFSDVITLLDSLKDPWVKQFVKSNAMSASLMSLKQLEPLFQTASSSLGSPRDVRFIQEVDDILMIPTESFLVSDAFQNVFNCKTAVNGVKNQTTDNAYAFLESVKVLDTKIELANNALKSLSGVLDTTETKKLLGDVINLCSTSDNSTVMQGIVDTLRNLPQLHELYQKFENTSSIRGDVFKEPKKEADAIIRDTTYADDLITKLSSFHPFFKCLSDLSDDDVKLVNNGIAVSKHLRSSTRDPEVVTRGEAAINEVVFSGSSLKTLITAIENVKGYSSAESDALKSLPDHQKHSMTIGLATLRVSAMAMTLQKGQDLAVIIRGFGVVGKNVNLVKNPEDVRNLRAVVRIGSSLDIMLQQVKTWRDGVNGTRSTVLASHSDIFSSAASITGMTGDFGSMAKSVGVLAEAVSDPNDKTQLNGVKSALESLATVNLNFASFTSNQMADPHASLSALDLFFANFNPIVSVTGGANSSGGGSLGPGQQLVLQSSTTDKAGSSSSILGIVIGGIVGAGVVAGAVGGILWFVRRRKMKKTAELVEVTARDENSETPDVSAPPEDDLELDRTQSYHGAPPSEDVAKRYHLGLIGLLKKCEEEVEKILDEQAEKAWQQRERIREFHRLADPDPEKKPPPRKPEQLSLYQPMERLCLNIIEYAQKNDRPVELTVVTKHLSETRKCIALEPTTRVTLENYGSRFETNYIHANFVTFPNKLKMVLTQLPMKAAKAKQKTRSRKSTIEKFWWMAKQLKTLSVVFFNTEQGLDWKSDRFFPSKPTDEPMQFDRLKVTCLSRSAVLNYKRDENDPIAVTRQILVEFEDETPITLTVYQHYDFRAESGPGEVCKVTDILRSVRHDPTPVIVVCTDGVSRSAAFAFAELEYQSLCNNESNLTGNLISLRNQRSKSLNNPLQLAFCIAAVIELAFDGNEPRVDDIRMVGNCYTVYRLQTFNNDVSLKAEPSASRRRKGGLEDSEAGEDTDEMDRMVVPNRPSFAISRFLFSARRFFGWTGPMTPAETRDLEENSSLQLVDEAAEVV